MSHFQIINVIVASLHNYKGVVIVDHCIRCVQNRSPRTSHLALSDIPDKRVILAGGKNANGKGRKSKYFHRK